MLSVCHLNMETMTRLVLLSFPLVISSHKMNIRFAGNAKEHRAFIFQYPQFLSPDREQAMIGFPRQSALQSRVEKEAASSFGLEQFQSIHRAATMLFRPSFSGPKPVRTVAARAPASDLKTCSGRQQFTVYN